MFRKPKKRPAPALSMAMAETKLKPGADLLVVDVRSREAFREGHLPYAKNVALDRLRQGVPKWFPKDTTILFYGESFEESEEACQLLITAGYRNGINIGSVKDYSGKLFR